MDVNFLTIKNCPLFIDISESDINSLIRCLGARRKKFNKGDIIFSAGEYTEHLGVVVNGCVHIVQEDYWGNRSILSAAHGGELFAEAFSAAGTTTLPVTVLAQVDCEVMLVSCKHLLTTCSNSCVFHARLIQNLMKTLADKNIFLTKKIEHITKKTTKERVISYLSECAFKEGNNTFLVPFNRQELADYLSVERSALSNTLSKMRREGVIDFNKNRFKIL